MSHPAAQKLQPVCERRSLSLAGLKVHLIGIGGCGMSGAAGVLVRRGAEVSGSDCSESDVLQQLSSAGITVCVGHFPDNLPEDADLVVASAAVPEDNPELLAARALGKRTIKYADLLGEIMNETVGVAVAGTHGKSTATALTAFLCREAGLDPSFVVGAESKQLGGGSGVGEGECFIVEACEYDRSFLKLAPTHAVILNIEEDHLDCFENLEEIIEAFSDFAALVPSDGMLLVNHDDPVTARAVRDAGCNVQSFGFRPSATWSARKLVLDEGMPSFELVLRGQPVGRVRLSLPGRHNVYNALAASALAHRCGADLDRLLEALGEFRGTQRRQTHRGRYRGIDIIDDYAHHPTEIRATLAAIRDCFGQRRLRVVFQPHQHSRTRFFLEDFADSFELADEVIVPDIYFVRDSASEKQLISSKDLVELIRRRGGKACYIADLDEIPVYLAEHAGEAEVLVTMGAGDVWKVADEMVRRLRDDC